MITKTSGCYEATVANLKPLLEGVAISIDPSIGSTSSMPGYAVYRQTELIDSGILRIPPHLKVWERLRRLANHMRRLYKTYDPDILIYEEIPSQRQGGGNANSHASLLKALGVILSVPGPDGYVGIYPVSWKKHARSSYVKGDEEDAREIGYVVLELAKRIRQEKEEAGTKRSRTR